MSSLGFNRNMKRIAGPGFMCNVRYDDYQVSKQKNNGKAPKLLTKGVRLPELFDVKEQELLVAISRNKENAGVAFKRYLWKRGSETDCN